MSQGPVIIVGAGLAGLRCANVLSDAGVDIVVLERGQHVGGRVITDDVDGFKIDRGFQLLNPSYPQVERGLDLKDLDLQLFDPGMVLSDGVTHSQVADPLRSPGKILATLRAPLGPLTSRLHLARLLLALKGKQRKPVTINPDQPSAAWMLEKGIDRTTIDALLRPFLAGVLLEDELETSARITSLLLRSFTRGVPGVPAGGMGAIPHQMAARLGEDVLHLETPVTAVTANSVVLEDGSRLEGSAVVLATAGQAASLLLQTLRAPSSNSVTTWWYSTNEPLRTKATLVVDQSMKTLINSVEMTAAAPQYAPPGKYLVAASAIGLHPEVERERSVRERLSQLHRRSTKEWELVSMSLVADALPRYSSPFLLRPEVVVNGVFVAGDHRATPSIQGAMVSGERAARAILAQR
ncbi:MAG: NAD(P)-binding protein [Actinobacteria bacterium]|uniref:Unannotated protein n=1 Tax=freshwater metagenome TaxID=449393 RepID=A0A6J6ZKG5_9ZZZZ|nr:NAD(P)-binding protein [Actinomycetota bacterium]MSX10275.1 NAD(P)-binding protein [Actinomycetota bacterium]MSX67481.1 NAD(P)-binding protein [Actinomycetota bacterium]